MVLHPSERLQEIDISTNIMLNVTNVQTSLAQIKEKESDFFKKWCRHLLDYEHFLLVM